MQKLSLAIHGGAGTIFSSVAETEGMNRLLIVSRTAILKL